MSEIDRGIDMRILTGRLDLVHRWVWPMHKGVVGDRGLCYDRNSAEHPGWPWWVGTRCRPCERLYYEDFNTRAARKALKCRELHLLLGTTVVVWSELRTMKFTRSHIGGSSVRTTPPAHLCVRLSRASRPFGCPSFEVRGQMPVYTPDRLRSHI